MTVSVLLELIGFVLPSIHQHNESKTIAFDIFPSPSAIEQAAFDSSE